jgi:hypothetical protein
VPSQVLARSADATTCSPFAPGGKGTSKDRRQRRPNRTLSASDRPARRVCIPASCDVDVDRLMRFMSSSCRLTCSTGGPIVREQPRRGQAWPVPGGKRLAQPNHQEPGGKTKCDETQGRQSNTYRPRHGSVFRSRRLVTRLPGCPSGRQFGRAEGQTDGQQHQNEGAPEVVRMIAQQPWYGSGEGAHECGRGAYDA